jgi:hypothetical protein
MISIPELFPPGHSPMLQWSKIVRICISDGVPKRSLLVAIVVGTVLNLINQADALIGHGHFDPVKAALTFAVPYCVATYGAVSYRLKMDAEASHSSKHPAHTGS